ncbi:MAG: ATP-grasp domain-containing protein [Nitrospinota bacterium]
MAKQQVNVLITAASRRVALIRSFSQALSDSGHLGKVVVTDTDSLSAGLFFSDKFYAVPLSGSPEYISSIKEVCRKEDINLLIPTIDEELPLFGRYKDDFKKAGVRIPVSDHEVGEICNDKYKTYLFFKENSLPIANTYLPDMVRRVRPKPPLFIKPRIGRGAVSSYPINTEKELDFFLEYVENPVVQDYLPGKEFTIDVLCDYDSRVISVVPRERLVIRSGVSDRGITYKHQGLIDTSMEVASKLRLIGAANLQCKLDGDKITFFEVNPRFSGAIQLTIRAGANFPAMLIAMQNGGVSPCIGEFRENLTMVSYEESLYHPPKMPKR